MITKFKLYESFNRQLKIGDYVVIGEDIDAVYDNFKIGKDEIGQFYTISGGHYWFNFNNKKISLKPEKIMFWSENKDELEMNLKIKKYNL